MAEPAAQRATSPTAIRTNRPSSPRWALASLALATLMPSLDTSIANASLPALAHGFDASFQAVQWIVLAYLLVITGLIVSVGRVGDLFGRQRLLTFGIGLFTLASLACGLAPTLAVLICCRALQGVGAAVMISLTVALVGEAVPRTKIGSAMGLLGTMSAIGTTLGPSLGGLLISGLGWRSIFFINVPLGLLNLLLARRYLPRDEVAAGTRATAFDLPGTALLALTLAVYSLAMTLGRGQFGLLNAALLFVALLGGVLFVRVQARSASPLVRLPMVCSAALGGSMAMNVLVATVIMTTLVVGPFFLTCGLGLDIALTGLVLSAGPMTSVLTGFLAGRIVDHLGAPRMRSIGLAEMALGAFALSVLPEAFGVPGYLVAIVILTPGYQLFQAANRTVVMSDVQRDQRGVVSGMLSLSRNLGLISGASVMGAIFGFASQAAHTSAALAAAAGMRVTFTVAGCPLLVALAISLTTRARGEAAATDDRRTRLAQFERS